MKIAHFAKILKGNNAVRINDDLIIFNDFELYNIATDESKNYDSLDALINDNPDVKDIIEKAEYFELHFDGGRGAGGSTKGSKMGFNHANHGGRDGTKTMLNAELNFDTAKGNSLTAVMKRFKDKYGKADHEYGALVDEQGFVHHLRNGNKHNVTYAKPLDGMTIVHNHPGGGNFSDTDLITTATTKARGVIATSSNTGNRGKTYHFQKNNNFKAKDFVKALRNATWDEKLGYDKGASQWLRANQRKFGYKYSSTKLIGE